MRKDFEVEVAHNYKYLTTKIVPVNIKLKFISMMNDYRPKKLIFDKFNNTF